MSTKYKTDNAGQMFARVENARVTIAHRKGDQDWAGTGRYLKVQAYQDAVSEKLFPDPDIPIRNQRADEETLDAAVALLKLLVS